MSPLHALRETCKLTLVGWGVVRAVLAVLPAFMLGACATGEVAVTSASPPPSGNWQIKRGMDRIAGHVVTTVFLVSRASTTKQMFAQPVGLQLMCFKGEPIVRFGFDFRVGANKTANFGYRFDEKPGHDAARVSFLPDFRTVIIKERPDVIKFVDELATSDVLFVRVGSLYAGLTTAEFRVTGAAAAIEMAYADCPLSTNQPHRPKSASAEEAQRVAAARRRAL